MQLNTSTMKGKSTEILKVILGIFKYAIIMTVKNIYESYLLRRPVFGVMSLKGQMFFLLMISTYLHMDYVGTVQFMLVCWQNCIIMAAANILLTESGDVKVHFLCSNKLIMLFNSLHLSMDNWLKGIQIVLIWSLLCVKRLLTLVFLLN